jgi:hypothetical protein
MEIDIISKPQAIELEFRTNLFVGHGKGITVSHSQENKNHPFFCWPTHRFTWLMTETENGMSVLNSSSRFS